MLIIDELIKELKNQGFEIDIKRQDVLQTINYKNVKNKATLNTSTSWTNRRAKIKNYIRR